MMVTGINDLETQKVAIGVINITKGCHINGSTGIVNDPQGHNIKVANRITQILKL